VEERAPSSAQTEYSTSAPASATASTGGSTTSAGTTVHIPSTIEEEAASVKNKTDAKIQELEALLLVTAPGPLYDAVSHLIDTLTDLSGKFSNIATTGSTTSSQSTTSTVSPSGGRRSRRNLKSNDFENLKMLQAHAMSEADFLASQVQNAKKTWLSLFW